MSEIQVMPQAPAVNHGAVLRQIAQRRLADKPLSWAQIEHELDLPRKELTSYRWLAAAKIKAERPRITWKALSCDPCVELKESTLKTGHRSAVLPTGQTWDEYREAYQAAMHARLTALQQAEGTKAAESFFAGVQMLGEVVTGLVADLKDQRDNPPALFGTGTFDKDGIEHELHATEQLVFTFPGMEGEETVERKRRTLAFNTRLRMEAEGLARAQRIVGYLLTGKKIEEPEGETAPREATEAEVIAAHQELSVLVDELRQYELEVAA